MASVACPGKPLKGSEVSQPGADLGLIGAVHAVVIIHLVPTLLVNEKLPCPNRPKVRSFRILIGVSALWELVWERNHKLVDLVCSLDPCCIDAFQAWQAFWVQLATKRRRIGSASELQPSWNWFVPGSAGRSAWWGSMQMKHKSCSKQCQH